MAMSAKVRNMNQSVEAAGGVGYMQKVINDTNSLSQINRVKLDECLKILRDEEKEDQELRQNYKRQMLTRKPSSALNVEFHDQMKTYESVFLQAQIGDKFIVDKFEGHRMFIELLSDSKRLQQELGRCISQHIFLASLAEAYQAFDALKNHVNEGIKFHQDLSKLILTMHGKFSAFCSTRQTEKVALLRPPTQAMSQGVAPAPTQAMSRGVAPAPTQAMSQGAAPAPTQAMSQGAAPAPTQAMNQGAAPAPTQAKTMLPKQPEALSDKGIYYVASQLGFEWKHVVVNLGLKHAQLEQMMSDYPHNVKQQTVSALMKWRDDGSLDRVATDSSNEEKLAELFDALTVADRTDLVEDVKKRYNVK